VASKKQRQRELARQAHERRAQRQQERDKRAKTIAVVSIVVVFVLGIGLGSAALAGAFSSSKAKPAAATTPKVTPSATASPSASASASPSSTAAMVDGKCIYTKSGTAARTVNLPSATPDLAAKYTATINTNRGDIVIDLLNSAAPCTVNSFVSLADQAYFNNTHCHRLTTAASGIYVLQCGDPTGTGTGGPGYVFNSENLTGAKYPAGTVAMANTGQPDSNGSQFFLVYQNTPLPADYTPFGTIVSGLNIIQNVAKAGSDNSNGAGDGHPKEKVEINSVTITKT
jgi:peptidyl-prolyl cis-trans isomerase B (cyclophilin B)